MSLQQQGFRFIRRGGVFKWAHPADMSATDIDCTDMSDDQFEAFVAGVEAA